MVDRISSRTRKEAEQLWLNERLQGLEPDDFETRVMMVSTCDLKPPPSFEEVWISLGEGFDIRPEECVKMRAVVIFGSPSNMAEVALVESLVQFIDDLGNTAPPVFWVFHGAKPTGHPNDIEFDISQNQEATRLMGFGLDGLVGNEPAGFRLALMVRTRIHASVHIAGQLQEMSNERRARSRYADSLKDSIHDMLWDYLRVRVAPSIPALDPGLNASGVPRSMANYNIGDLIGKGTTGEVYKLHFKDSRLEPCNQVVKIADKSDIMDLCDLKCVKRHIDVMCLLSSSMWRHPNIVQLYQTYHSATHILFRMEFGGQENLYRRLCFRQKSGPLSRPLSYEKVKAIISQAVEVIMHLHVGPHVCHRDIKPENLLVDDTGGQIFLKIADFDLAVVQEHDSRCRSPCGTVPFTAPEVGLEPTYDGFAADIWSLGIVILEVLCCLRIVESSLNLGSSGNASKDSARQAARLTQQIRNGFAEPTFLPKLLQEHCRSELRECLPAMLSIQSGMLDVLPHQRMRAPEIKELLVEANLYVETCQNSQLRSGHGGCVMSIEARGPAASPAA
jgi:serine/threonine protein kinase